MTERIERLLERILATGRPLKPADPSAIQQAIDQFGLPDCPAYAGLMARSNGFMVKDLEVLGVGGPGASTKVDPIAEWAEAYAPIVPLAANQSLRYGWHTEERAWVCEAALEHRVDTFVDDAELLHAAFITGAEKKYVPKPPKVTGGGPTLRDLEARGDGPAPTADDERRAAFAAFSQRYFLEPVPPELAALLERHDGLSIGDLRLFGVAELRAEPEPNWFVRVGTAGDEVLGFDRREGQWKALGPDLDTIAEHPRFVEFSALIAHVAARYAPEE